jgi:hypothetical protein
MELSLALQSYIWSIVAEHAKSAKIWLNIVLTHKNPYLLQTNVIEKAKLRYPLIIYNGGWNAFSWRPIIYYDNSYNTPLQCGLLDLAINASDMEFRPPKSIEKCKYLKQNCKYQQNQKYSRMPKNQSRR